MEQTTQSPPAPEKTAASASGTQTTPPLQATEKDFQRWPRAKDGAAFRVGGGVAVVVLLVAAFFVYRQVSSYETTDDAKVDGQLNSISARISGHVIKLNVQDNQYVEAGTVLVEIDPADYQVAYESAKADFEDSQAAVAAAGGNVRIPTPNTTSQVSSAEADVASARSGIAAAKKQFDAANAQRDQAEANNVKAKQDLGRYKQLVDKEEISLQQYDQAVAASKASAA